ncbi:Putative ankyrin repeat-containing domain superfamily [Colletotrichum destructivum]|uniref:Ankyrin repeat-containing domain superfamily n=1 Tax=Colletotrichum destructivum TaxID=34406 RepID=A0AAX4IPE0_9PEZI|nr:Putative ankyrin repeat-containing domain superfamily [Colletotrichum destructivum]
MTTYSLKEDRPFRENDKYGLEVPEIADFYCPDHPLMQQLCDACARGQLDEFKRLVEEWKAKGAAATPPPGPEHYPLGTLEPILFFAVRQHQHQIVAYLLDEGLKRSELVMVHVHEFRCRPPMLQVMLDRGWDINFTNSPADPPRLAFVLDDKELVEWYLAHGADPNAEAKYGWTPWLRAIVRAPLDVIKIMHAAGGRMDLAVPFVCFGRNYRSDKSPERLDVLRYLLDNGADINARLFAHNHYNRGAYFDPGPALNLALGGGQDDIAKELLDRGARTDIPAGEMMGHVTALERAREKDVSPHLLAKVEECRRREVAEAAKGTPTEDAD